MNKQIKSFSLHVFAVAPRKAFAKPHWLLHLEVDGVPQRNASTDAVYPSPAKAVGGGRTVINKLTKGKS